MVVAEDRVGALALQLVDGLERLLAVAGAGISPGRDQGRGEVGGTPAPALREMRPGRRVLLRLEVLRPERQMRKPVGVVAPDDPVGEPEGVGHRAVGEERDEGALQHLRIARVGLEGLAVVARRGGGVAQRAGDIGRKIVALEAVRRLEAGRRRRPRRQAARGGGRRGRDAGRGDEQNRDESGEKARVRQRHEVRLQGGRAGARSSLIGKSARTMDSRGQRRKAKRWRCAPLPPRGRSSPAQRGRGTAEGGGGGGAGRRSCGLSWPGSTRPSRP